MLKITANIERKELLTTALKKVSDATSDLITAFKAAGKQLEKIEADNFQSENAKGKSGRWKPLSKAYEKQKLKKFGTFALLAGVEIATEKLYKSLTGKTSDSIERIDKQEAAFGTSLKYAKAQHFGYAPRNLPARPLIDPSDEQLKEISKVMRKEIVKEVKRTTFVVTEIGEI